MAVLSLADEAGAGMTSCSGCRWYYRDEPLPLFILHHCALRRAVVGFECPLGIIETGGCSAYEPPPSFPLGAIP